MIRIIKGFRDILPADTALWQHVEETARALFEDFGFREVRVPLMEKTELFARGIGQDTDIVEKEMYTFPDRKKDLLTLRPEATAGTVRSYIENGFGSNDPVQKWYTLGPMFRRERPQKGRFRQFFQLNAEFFGVESPRADILVIALLHTLLARLDVPDVTAHVNSLGCPKCRPEFKKRLNEFIADKMDTLCENCRRRSDTNPLRVLDCKVPACREAVAGAPEITDTLCGDCEKHFEAVKAGLASLGIPFELDKRLVRGLDYYTRTTFEIQTGSLGAQNAVAGGGRYDGLVEMLGGPPTPAVGFAVGEDRLLELLQDRKEAYSKPPDLYLACLGEAAGNQGFLWLMDLVRAGIRAEMDYAGRSLKSQMKRADRLKARFTLMVGDNELESGRATLKNMATSDQTEVALNDLAGTLPGIVRGR